ncbi:CG6296, partial [Drosophila busckii]
ALPIEDAARINGQNGWYVPQLEGGLKWLSLDEAAAQLTAYETLNDLELDARISLNAVTFYLYTKSNPTIGQVIKPTKESIDLSNFNAAHPTRFTIHGWNSNYKDGVNTGVRDAWFLQGDYNMIAVDWARGRSLEYASSVAGVPATGKKIATLIDFLVNGYSMSLKTLEIVGFSLGAHVAGHSAKQVSSGVVQKVVGLDPAMPLISYEKPAKRLSSNDAHYVESIQTNGGTLGYTKPIGRAAFYPNGGKTQPGCTMDVTGSCSHTRAVSYYVESLRMDDFPSMKCKSHEQAHNKDCGNTYSSVRMGSPLNENMAVGEFYVPVNNAYPYGLGEPIETTTPVSTTTQRKPTPMLTTSTARPSETTTYPNTSSSSVMPTAPSTTPAPAEDT